MRRRSLYIRRRVRPVVPDPANLMRHLVTSLGAGSLSRSDARYFLALRFGVVTGSRPRALTDTEWRDTLTAFAAWRGTPGVPIMPERKN